MNKKSYLLFFYFVYYLLVVVVTFLGIGFLIDSYFDTKPLFIIIGTIVGAIFGLYIFIQKVIFFIKN